MRNPCHLSDCRGCRKRGWFNGPCREYLYDTVKGMQACGIRDHQLEKLAAAVQQSLLHTDILGTDCWCGLCGCGGMVDAADSKSASGDRVGVQVPSAVPPNFCVIGSNATPAFGHILTTAIQNR